MPHVTYYSGCINYTVLRIRSLLACVMTFDESHDFVDKPLLAKTWKFGFFKRASTNQSLGVGKEVKNKRAPGLKCSFLERTKIENLKFHVGGTAENSRSQVELE